MRRQEEGGLCRVGDLSVYDRAWRDVLHPADTISRVLGEEPGTKQPTKSTKICSTLVNPEVPGTELIQY